MKTVIYHGKEFEVNDWVNFIATDCDGKVWEFEDKPYSSRGYWLNREQCGKCKRIGSLNIDNWESSLENCNLQRHQI